MRQEFSGLLKRLPRDAAGDERPETGGWFLILKRQVVRIPLGEDINVTELALLQQLRPILRYLPNDRIVSTGRLAFVTA